jgi:ribulose-phosphate 3-epimerase
MMDAHFVPPLSVGPVVVESIRPITELPLHCHLMVARPRDLFEDLAKAGADMVTPHYEAVFEPQETAAHARELGMRVGMAVNPETRVEVLFPFLELLDNVIVMTLARTGWAGQPFEESNLPKIEALRAEIDRRGLQVDVEVDGGINEESAGRCVAAGATVLAAASSIFKAPDPAAAARGLRGVTGGGS